MRLSHARPAVSAVFDEANLVSGAGLAPVVALGQRCRLTQLVAGTLTIKARAGANAHLKVPALVAGMVAGADSIEDMDLLRHGAMSRLFEGVRAPSTLGSFLRSFTFGHVRQLDAVAARLLERLARGCPLLPGAGTVAYVDIDDTVREVHGYAKQGVGFGYSGVKGLNALLATVSTPTSAPVIAATRLRRGSVNSARGPPARLDSCPGAATRSRAHAGTATASRRTHLPDGSYGAVGHGEVLQPLRPHPGPARPHRPRQGRRVGLAPRGAGYRTGFA